MCPPDRLRTCLGKAEVLNLALLYQVLHRARHIFDRYGRVDTVLVEQVDNVGPQPLQRCLGNLPDVLRAAVQASSTLSRLGIDVEAELGGDHHLLTEGGKGFADELFVDEGP